MNRDVEIANIIKLLRNKMDFIELEPIKPYNNEIKKKRKNAIIEIISGNDIFDLHNAGEFLEFRYNLRNRLITLDWLYYDHDGKIHNYLLRFECFEVKCFSIIDRDPEIPESEDDILEDIIYNDIEDFISFHFLGGRVIKIYCQKVKFSLKKHEIHYPGKP